MQIAPLTLNGKGALITPMLHFPGAAVPLQTLVYEMPARLHCQASAG